jgi:hypothetical protein
MADEDVREDQIDELSETEELVEADSEVPVADAEEQHRATTPEHGRSRSRLGDLEANPADAQEQDLIVEGDEDEYR